MSEKKLKISNTIIAPGSLNSGAIEFYKDGLGILYQFVGDLSNTPIMVGTTLQSISQTIIAPMSNDEITILRPLLTIEIIKVIVVTRASGSSINFGLYSTSDRTQPVQTMHFDVNDFGSGNPLYPTANTTGYSLPLNTNLVTAGNFLVLNIFQVLNTTEEVFIHIDYKYRNPV